MNVVEIFRHEILSETDWRIVSDLISNFLEFNNLCPQKFINSLELIISCNYAFIGIPKLFADSI